MDKGLFIEYLGADMAMEPLQLQARQLQRAANPLQRLSRFQGKAKLGIDLPRADKTVGVGVDARGDPQIYGGRPPQLARCGGQALQLGGVVRHNPAHARLQSQPQLGLRLVISVEIQSLRREPRL